MTDLIEFTSRLRARAERRAVPVRDTSRLSPDPPRVFGIAPIRVVSEQQVQAIAYGEFGSPPHFVTRWNPLGRDAGDMEPFAADLDAYLSSMLADEQMPRVWLPHPAALEVLDVLGHRLRRNPRATEALRQLGGQSRALVIEHEFPGQQAVAVAADLLRAHVVTGQTPTEEHHLGAYLAWLQPPPGFDPAEVARERSLVPAAAMLTREADDAIERLRKIAKRRGSEAATARAEIEHLLTLGARREWELLVAARDAFWSLRLPVIRGIDHLVADSFDRLAWAVAHDPNPPSRPMSLRRRLQTLEAAAGILKDIDVRGDLRVREQMRQKGRVVRAEMFAVNQPKRNQHPCTITLHTDQRVLRIRRGTRLQTADTSVQGRVDQVSNDNGATVFVMTLIKGVRKYGHLALGAEEDWYDTVVYNNPFLRRKIDDAAEAARSDLVFGDTLPPKIRRARAAADLLAIADGLRRA